MSVQVGTAFVGISPDLSTFQQQVSTQMAPITGKLGKFAKAGAGVATVGVAVGAVGKALYDVGAEFDSAYDKIQTGTGATGQKLEGLKGSFKNVVSAVPADFGDAADAITQLNQRLGISGAPLEKMSKQMLELSRITDTDLTTNIEAATRTFGDWGIKVNQQPAFLDKMFRASQQTGISVSDLGEQMVRYGAPLRQMGFGFSEAAAMVGKFEKEGVNAQLVMGSLRIALGKMASEGVKDPSEALGTLTDRIKAAGSAGEANKLAIETFGARAGPDMAAAIREGRFEFDDLVKSIDGGKNSIMKTGQQTQDFGERWKVLKNQVLVAIEPIATRVFNAIGEGMRQVTMLMKGKGSLHDSLVQVKSDLAPLIPVFKFVFDSIKNHLSGMVTAAKLGFNVIRGAVLVVTGLMKGDFGQMWRGIKTMFGSYLRTIADYFRNSPLVSLAQKIGNGIVSGFNAVKAVAGVVKNAIAGAVGAVRNAISAASNAATSLANAILSPLRSVVTKAKTIAQSIIGAIKSGLSAGADFGRFILEEIVQALNDAIPNSISVPKAPDIDLPDNPIALARGTDFFRGGTALVGERGPELLDLPRGSAVTPAGATQRILSGIGSRAGSRGVENVNFDIEVIGDGNPDTGHLIATAGQRLRALGV